MMQLLEKNRRLVILVFCISYILATLAMCSRADAREIKQSTAANVMIFMVDSTDHVTGKGSLTITITESKDGGAFASITPTITERGNGWYNLSLTTSHTDTLGDLALHITSTGADPTDLKMTVVANIESDTYAAVGSLGSPMQAGAAVTLAASQPNYAPAKAGDAMTLNAAYDAAKTAASQSSVNAIPTNPLLASSYTAPDNAGITAIKNQTDQLVFSGGRVNSNSSLDAAAVSAAIWGEPLPGSFGDGTAGAIVGGSVYPYVSAILEQITGAGVMIADTEKSDIASRSWNSTYAATRKLTSPYTEEGTPHNMADVGAADPAAIWAYANRSLTYFPYTLPVMEGSAYSAVAIQSREITIVKKNSITIPFSIKGGDYSAWSAWFGAKAKLTDSGYAIAPRECDGLSYDPQTDTTTGSCSLTVTDTSIVQDGVVAEVQLRSGSNAVTPLRFTIKLLTGVFN